MQSCKILILFFVSSVLFFCGCTQRNTALLLEHTNFTDEIAQEQNLVFTFEKNLVSDSLLNRWDTTGYIIFSPAVKGKFNWTAANELTFSPFSPFAPATDFEATITDKIFSHSKEKLSLPKDQKIKFHTPYLTLLQAQVFWAASEKNPGAIETRFNLHFNNSVLPAELSKRLHIFVADKEIPFDVLTGNADNVIGVSIADLRGDSKADIPYKIQIDEGMPGVGASVATKGKMEAMGEIPSKEKIMITEMTASFEQGTGMINVFANQPVTNDDIKSLITLSPSISFTAEKLDNGFALKGDFESDKTYAVTISKELQGIFGYTLDEDYSQNVAFGELLPTIAFSNGKSMYLSSIGSRNIGVNISSINKIKVSVAKVYANNILSFIRSGMQWGYFDEQVNGEYVYHDYRYYDYTDYGDSVSQKNYTVQSLPKNGNMRLLNLNLNDLNYNDKFKGLYLVKVQDADHQWLQQSRLVSLSDIGLIAHESEDEIYVFANSILNADALPGVKITFISTNNQIVQTITTDDKGVAILKNAKAALGNFEVGMITASLGDDFNFIILNNTYVETSRYDVGGKMSNEANLDAFIYGDRDIYRPGDSVHVNTIVRTTDWKILSDAPMKIKLLLPSGKEYQSFKKTPDAEGAFETSFYLPPAIVTGQYTIEVYSGNDVFINSKRISVEEFVPDRIKLDVQLDKEQVKPGESITANVTATNLFGPPAANRNYEINLSLKKKDFSAKKFSDYDFAIQTADKISLEDELRQGKTDANGKASEKFDIPDLEDIGILHGLIYTTVFDETGRPVHKLNEFDDNTQDVFFGVKTFDTWTSTRQPLTFQFMALNAGGQVVNATAQVEIYKINWENVIVSTGGRYTYQAQRKDQLMIRKQLSLDPSGGKLDFTPVNSGEYEVRIMRPGAANYVSEKFYAYGWGDTQNTSFEVSTEGEVTMQLDKEKYSVGDKAQVLLKSPFEGKILVTVEQNQLYDYYYVNTNQKAASVTIPIKDDYVPNVYITATAIRKMTDNSLPLTVARGYIPLMVDKPQNKLPVSITVADQSRSKTKEHIAVQTAPNAELTIAVVDEGILQLKNTLTPDPFNYFYQQRALEVESFDLYPFLFPEYKSSTGLTGGDLAELNRRVNPFTTKRFNLVALWSGIKKADGNGQASFDINIPQFSGALRVMAVAYKDNSFGSSDKMIKVADPIVISTALPRFLAPKDTVTVPVTLSNTTTTAAQASAEISLTGPLTLAGPKTQSVSLNPNSEGQVVFSVIANTAIGEGTVTINVKNKGENFSDQTNIAVRPASTLQRKTSDGVITGGQSQSFTLNADMIPSTVDAKLILSKSPMAQLSGDLRYLIQYPYGCIEQTVSSAFPQLYYRELAKAVGQEGKAIQFNPDYNVQQAIKKIESMQLYNGAFSYWPGGDYESWWGTAYAAHFLNEAKKAGFDVNDNILDKMYGYLQFRIKSKETETYYYWDENDISRRSVIVAREIPYSMFVLALVGKFDQSAMNYYKAHPELLSLDEKYMLSCTYALAGNQASFKDMLPAAFAGETSQRESGGSFASPVRDEALALLVLLEADPDNPQIGIMAKHLSEKLKTARWLSTQDRAFAFLALGKIAKKAQQSNIQATVSVDGKQIGIFSGNDLVITDGIANQNVTIQTSGNGSLYYFWAVNGISSTGSYKQEDSYLKVRKAFYDRNGKSINPASIRQNDLVVIKLTLQALDYKSDIQNVAVTDLLPAGLEIENPRISAIPELSWIKDNDQPDYMDIRDDRITFFATATGQPKNFYYVTRAVSKGEFHMGPVSADAMYDGEYHSYNGAGTVIIR